MPDDSKNDPSADELDPKGSAPPSDARPSDAPTADAPSEALGVTPPEGSAKEAPVEPADEPSDAASPAAILKRVSALDEEDEGERLARAEEEKLEARRDRDRKPKKKGGLEAAASKRLAKIGAKSPSKRVVVTAEDADPLLEKATDFSEWAKKNQRLVTGVVALAVVAVVGSLGFTAYERKRETDASVQLAKAVADERGRIGDPDKEEDPDRPHDPTPVFKSIEARRDAALAGFRTVESTYHGTGAAMLARLSEGSLLLDKEDAEGALAAYADVSASPLAKADAEVRGRALEGMGFAFEAKADAQPGDGAKDLLEQAAKQYRTLENTDVAGFKELGMYHQARIFQKQGNKSQAIEVLKKLHERLHKDTEEHEFVYLEQVADDALRSLDPNALPPKASAPGLGMGRPGARGKNQIDPAQLQKMYEQMQKAAAQKAASGGAPPGAAPGGSK